MQLKATFGALGTLRVMIALTAAYLLAMAVWSYSPDFGAERVLIGEAMFGVPMMIACGLSMWLDSVGARRVLLGFAAFYVLFTLAIFSSTFAGEQDAQWQLLLLQVPMGGFPALVIAGILAALFGRAGTR